MTDRIDDRTLYALFCLSRATLPIDTAAIADSAGVSTTEAGRALVRLERAGLVDASRARLTMVGLARAVALTSDLGGTAPVATTRGRANKAERLPMAAKGDEGETEDRPGDMM